MTRGLRSFAHSVCNIQIHIVFVTKYRHAVISGQIESDIVQLITSICQQNRCILLEAKADLGENDHIHLLIDLAPDVSISKLCNTLKTVTSREIRKRFAVELKPYYWTPVFWKRGYCAVSAGGASLEILKNYIDAQGNQD
jgi:putative transposase